MKVRIGRLEIAFGAVLAVYVVLALLGYQGWGRLLGRIALGVLGFALSVRISRSVVRNMLWRLRNRLIVAYFFIAVVPLILITLLAGLGVALVGGQISVFLVTSELDRRTNAIRESMAFLARESGKNTSWAGNAEPFLRNRYPGLQLLLRERNAWRDVTGSPVGGPAPEWPQGSGILVKDRKLYGWGLATFENRSVMAVFPVTRDFLGQLAPDIGESTILNLETNDDLLHPDVDNPQQPSRNRRVPAANVFDFPIWWTAPIVAAQWDAPEKTETEWLNILTRPSAILRTVLSQKVDFELVIPVLLLLVGILFLIAEAISLLIGISLTRTITGAVHELYEGTVRVMKGDLAHRIPIGGNDQLGELSVSFNNMTSNMERLLVVEKERERLHTELEIAREVQNQLYPKRLPDVASLRLTAVCNPARMVSGDYYDYQQIGDTTVAIVVGDVAGKGISAALLMATVQSSFRAQLRGSLELAAGAGHDGVHVSVSTSRVVSHLNQQLHADTAPEKYATFFLGVYDEATTSITYTNAGHLPPILIRDGKPTLLEVNGMVVGAFPFAKYGESRVQLQPRDLLVFYTDGITEPENAYGEMFGEERLTELLVRSADQDEAEIVTAVTDAVRQWTGTDELQDDMTLLLVRQL
ncbi:MAG TPA: SpoIIE family protein phosphatase [Bryobacteraceae bacterium]|nr:SpoIIE family protein phosphatase [Bryobacteraceae bacterium]